MTFELSPLDRLVQEAVRLKSIDNAADAERVLAQALDLDPDHPVAMTILADIVAERRDYERAFSLLDRALAVEPACALAWFSRAYICWNTGRREEALSAATRAVEIQPFNRTFRASCVQYAAWLGEFALARTVLTPLLDAAPEDNEARALALYGLGALAIAECRFADGNRYLTESLRLRPDTATRFMLGLNQLRTGQFDEGWANFAAREQIKHYYPAGQPFRLGERWTGQDPKGGSLLIFDDQGHGDAIQFFRFLPMLRQRGFGAITWLTAPNLVRLFVASDPDVTVLGGLPGHLTFDFSCSSSALARSLSIVAETIPAPAAYLCVPRGAGTHLPRHAGRRPRIGLAWSGDPSHVRDHQRSIPAEQFLCLTDGVAAQFYSLQHKVRASDEAALEQRPNIRREIELAEDFADTAAFIDRLDLVITVDTSVAHIAGGLGKTVWLVIDSVGDWRWLTGRDDTPWYPSMRLFRCAASETGWQPVLSRVFAALHAWLDQRA